MKSHDDGGRIQPVPDPEDDPNTLSPLPGELGIPELSERVRTPVSRKGLFAVALLVLSMVAVSALSIQRFLAGKRPEAASAAHAGERPAATSVQPRRLDLTPAPASAGARLIASNTATTKATTTAAGATGASGATAPLRIPAIAPLDADTLQGGDVQADGDAEPIGVRRSGQAAPAAATSAGGRGGPSKTTLPEDAPAVLLSRPSAGAAGSKSTTVVGAPGAAGADNTSTALTDRADPEDRLAETRRHLEAYERQLQTLMENMTKGVGNGSTASGLGAARSTGASAPLLAAAPSGTAPPARPGTPISTAAADATTTLLGGALPRSSTPRVKAALLGDRSMILPKGTAFTCALQTKLVTSAAGLIGCQVQRNVFSDDGRVLLIERGSHLDGEFRIASLKPGSISIPVLWTRLRTPHGVTVDIDSPGTGRLGESGVDGYVDNRWGERIGAALLLSLIDDSVQLAIQHESSTSQGNAVVLPATTANTSKLADKVLDATINIPPLIYQNQGGLVGIVVARDVDFSAVYALQPVTP